MDAFLERYSLNTTTFRRLLTDSSALLSGSAALALYLEQEGVEAGYEPDDVDVWVATEEWEGLGDREQAWMGPWTDFLLRSGYHVTQNFRQLDQYMEHLDRIQRVVTFEREGKKVQFIVVSVTDLKEYVANHFDFSACMTWWSSFSECFETIYPTLTLGKKMFIRHRSISQGDIGRAEERLSKYRSRGFVLVDEPPPYYGAPDMRLGEDMACWEGIQAFDVWAYDEVCVADHLRQSEWNIVVGCGDSWGAFDRRALIRYMEERRLVNDVGVLYDTPYRQTVVHEAWDLLAYSDYSVYRLVDGVEQIINDVPKTIYAMEAYSTEGWRCGEITERIGHVTEMVRIDADDDDADDADSDVDQDDLHFLLSAEELGIDLPVPAIAVPVAIAIAIPVAIAIAIPVPDIPVPGRVSLSISGMSLSEADLYQQMMEWIGEP